MFSIKSQTNKPTNIAKSGEEPTKEVDQNPDNDTTRKDEDALPKKQQKLSPAERGSVPPLPYKEPPWGGLAPPPSPETKKALYRVEELKNGTVSKKTEFKDSPFFRYLISEENLLIKRALINNEKLTISN